MRVGVNLASSPFRRNRPMLVGGGALAALLLLLLATLIFHAWSDGRVLQRTRQTQARLDRDLSRLKSERAKYEGALKQPGNRDVLERSVMLNQLLLRKSISWTKIFADLEKTLPPNVRITQIRPQIVGANGVALEMTIASDSPAPLVLFVEKLEQSDMFGSAKVTVYQSPSQTDPFYRYRLSVNYAQKL